MTGKEKCEMLKGIRKTIAEMNGIEYEPELCNNKGECMGYCPKCDHDAEWLMNELRKKEAAGSPIRIDVESIEEFEELANEPLDDEEDRLIGKIVVPLEIPPLGGDVACPDDLSENVDSKQIVQGDLDFD